MLYMLYPTGLISTEVRHSNIDFLKTRCWMNKLPFRTCSPDTAAGLCIITFSNLRCVAMLFIYYPTGLISTQVHHSNGDFSMTRRWMNKLSFRTCSPDVIASLSIVTFTILDYIKILYAGPLAYAVYPHNSLLNSNSTTTRSRISKHPFSTHFSSSYPKCQPHYHWTVSGALLCFACSPISGLSLLVSHSLQCF
jgi:hypothetical protein